MNADVVTCLDQIWSSIEDLCAEFTSADWKKPTDLPGWSVQDQLSHLCGIEARLLGRELAPPLPEPWPAHVKNAIGAFNEGQIEARRSWAAEDVLTEFMELTAERLKELTEKSEQDLAAEVDGVLGRAPLRDVLAIRAVDCHYHEQDMRRATDKPGGLDNDAARFVVERMRAALPMIVGKKAAAPDGSVVAFDVTGPAGFRGSIRMESGRGVPASEAGDATATLGMDVETFLCLVGGRWDMQRASVKVDGDAALGQAVCENMNVMF